MIRINGEVQAACDSGNPAFRLKLAHSSSILGFPLEAGYSGAGAVMYGSLIFREVAATATAALGEGGAVNFLRGFVSADGDRLVVLHTVASFQPFGELWCHSGGLVGSKHYVK